MVLVTYLLAGPILGWVEEAPAIGARLETRKREARESLGSDKEGPSVDEIVENIEDAAMPSDDEGAVGLVTSHFI